MWSKPGLIKLKLIGGDSYSVNFKIYHDFELGKMYIGNNYVLYLFDEENEKFAINALKKIKSLKYGNEDMKNEFYKYLPKVLTNFKTITGKIGIVIEKDDDLILLKDLLVYSNGNLSASTVNLILKSLYNIICFIHFNRLIHNGISIDNYFISTKNQYGALLGGWWYSLEEGKDDISLSKEIFNRVKYKTNEIKEFNTLVDLESIKFLGRTLFEDMNGASLKTDNNIPKKLRNWLKENATDNTYEEYSIWVNISNYFINKNEVKINIDNDDLYKKLGEK